MKMAAMGTVGITGSLYGALAGQFTAMGAVEWAAGTGALALICVAALFVMGRRA